MYGVVSPDSVIWGLSDDSVNCKQRGTLHHALPPFVNRMEFMPNFSQLSYHKQVSKQSTFLVIMWNSTS